MTAESKVPSIGSGFWQELHAPDKQTRPRPKPYEENPATESRMVQTRYEPDEETYS